MSQERDLSRCGKDQLEKEATRILISAGFYSDGVTRPASKTLRQDYHQQLVFERSMVAMSDYIQTRKNDRNRVY